MKARQVIEATVPPGAARQFMKQPALQPLHEYALDTGDSNQGPIGFVVYVEARSTEEALAKIQESFDHDGEDLDTSGAAYGCRVYFNPDNFKIEDIVDNGPIGE